MGDVPDGSTVTDSVLTVSMDTNKNLTALFIVDPSIGRDHETEVVDVVNPVTGVTWMDRNLGASRAAMNSTDTNAYGDLYQWGRAVDGHEKRSSATTSTLSSIDQPEHGDFIITSSGQSQDDWRSPQNNTLWQGADGINNPCPIGYRLPTATEWEAEQDSWSSNNSDGAYGSPLKLPMAGSRLYYDGSFYRVGSYGYYWSSSLVGSTSNFLFFLNNNAAVSNNYRAYGFSVRCRKDGVSLRIHVEGSGSVDPIGGTFAPGTEVALTATPNTGWFFSEWKGDIPDGATVTDSVLTVTMDSDKNLSATFEKDINFGRDLETTVMDVMNPITGATWMDRNLGASQVAISLTDADAYGDLYQWGRAADGHQKRNSSTRTTPSSSDWPGHADFITPNSSPNDWRNPQNDTLWQDADGINNPCPVGYRLPTVSEWEEERQSWSSNNGIGAYGSPLKLPMPGFRLGSLGTLLNVHANGFYWSSSVQGSKASSLDFDLQSAAASSFDRTNGLAVRCIHDGFTLAIDVSGNGTVHPMGGSFTQGTQVELTATPTVGWVFSEWTGDVPNGATVTDSVLTVTMDSDKTLTAIFDIDPDFGRDTETTIVDVLNPVTGVTWMDRNLGASQAALSSTDSEAYGDLYQWGRAADGHQKRSSSITSTLSDTDRPDHGDFIIALSSPNDWRSLQNDQLWQGVDGTNNPCPVGYRLPTESEWDAELQSWSGGNSAGAYASPLKLTMAGYRNYNDGSSGDVGSTGIYWGSTVDGTNASNLYFDSGFADMYFFYRADGYSVRCLKE